MFEKNLEHLNNQELKTRLEHISMEEAGRHMSYCMSASNDYVILKNEIPLDDLTNPRNAVKDMLKANIKHNMEKNDIIITFGIGLGYILDEVYNTYPSRIIVYEPDIQLLRFVLANVDISEHLASGRVFITSDLNEFVKKLSEMYITKDKVEIVYLKNYSVVKNKELLVLTQKVYETCKSKMIDINTIKLFSRLWLINTLKNINTINNMPNAYSLCDLEGKFSGQTALILAAGPSLKDNIINIKANREKYVIFAVNKVLRVLEANGIVPDFAVCLDPSKIDITLAGLEDFCKKMNCIMDLKSDGSLFTKGFKRYFVSFSAEDFVVKKLADYNKFIKPYEAGGSASTLALVAAVKMGFSKIIFSGLDMAFKDDVIYSTGEKINKISDTQMAVSNAKKNIVKVKSVTGEMVQTRDDYAVFIHHFETLIKDLNYSEIYNTTSFGAKIEGMKNQGFDSIPLGTLSNGTPIILGEVSPFSFDIKSWTQEELLLINNVIAILSKGMFSPALVSAIVKSPILYQYMQSDILKVMQSGFSTDNAEEFIEKAKTSIKEVIDLLQKNRLI